MIKFFQLITDPCCNNFLVLNRRKLYLYLQVYRLTIAPEMLAKYDENKTLSSTLPPQVSQVSTEASEITETLPSEATTIKYNIWKIGVPIVNHNGG